MNLTIATTRQIVEKRNNQQKNIVMTLDSMRLIHTMFS